MSADDKLKKAFVAGLDISPDIDFESLKYRGIEEWTSVAHMQLISEIEDAFDVMLDTDEVIDMSSFVKAKEILRNHGVGFAT